MSYISQIFFWKAKRTLKAFLLAYHFIDLIVIKKESNINKKTLLLLKLDSIGDYILFRNFIEILKKSQKYGSYKITLCGNIAWKDLALTFDSAFIDDYIWVHVDQLYKNIRYRFAVLKDINQRGFETVIQPTYSREFFTEGIVRASNAISKIGSIGDDTQIPKYQKNIADRYYDQLIDAQKPVMFEFNRNKEFFKNLLKEESKIKRPFIDVSAVKPPEIPLKKYAVIFPGAQLKFKRWSEKKFASIANYLASKYNLEIVIAGSKGEKFSAKKIKAWATTINIIDLTGKTSLSQLVKIISDADLLISNDSCAIHMAAATNTAAIGVQSGIHFGRFSPYPGQVSKKIYSIYPGIIADNINNTEMLAKKYKYVSDLDIKDIQPIDVQNMIDQVLMKAAKKREY